MDITFSIVAQYGSLMVLAGVVITLFTGWLHSLRKKGPRDVFQAPIIQGVTLIVMALIANMYWFLVIAGIVGSLIGSFASNWLFHRQNKAA